MQRHLFILFFLWLCTLVDGRACENDTGPLQAKALSGLNGASRNLGEAMRCLQGKGYPEDINMCGISSFGSDTELKQVESCLTSAVPKSVRGLGPYSKYKAPQKIALLMECNKKNVLFVFRKQKGEFVVDGINFLLD